MLKFSANLSILFGEVAFLERFELAAKAGFKSVEIFVPYEFQKEALAEKLMKYGLEQVYLGMPVGNLAGGERGLACLPDRIGEFQDGVGLAIEYAKKLNCSRINCLVGKTPKNVPLEKVHQTMVDNLRFAATKLEKVGIQLLVEPLNNIDFPGFHLVHTKDILQLFKEINHKNLWLQYDIYHLQLMEGNLTNTIRENLARIAHIQIADVPGRHEPGTGEINFVNLLPFIDEMGYDGWIGCEYQPLGKTEDGFGWLKQYLQKGEN